MKDVVKFINEVKLELSRVIWPKMDEFIGSTIVVIVLVAIVAFYLFLLDSAFNRMMGYLFRFFSA